MVSQTTASNHILCAQTLKKQGFPELVRRFQKPEVEENTKLVCEFSGNAKEEDGQETWSLPPSLRDSKNGAPRLTLSGRPAARRASGPLPEIKLSKGRIRDAQELTENECRKISRQIFDSLKSQWQQIALFSQLLEFALKVVKLPEKD